MLPDKRQVSVKPAAILRCADGVGDRRLDPHRYRAAGGRASAARSAISTISIRSNAAAATAIVGAKLSEHGRANALDVRAFKLANGQFDLADRSHRAARLARDRAAFGLRALLDRAGPGLGLVPRGPHPSRPDGAAQQLPDLPVERAGIRCRRSPRCCRPSAPTKRRRARSPPNRINPTQPNPAARQRMPRNRTPPNRKRPKPETEKKPATKKRR